MADHEESHLIDPKSGFCKSNSTFYSKQKSLPLPQNRSLDVTTFISSQAHRGATAFIDAVTGNHLSFSDLWRSVDHVADGLCDLGVRRGDVVLILSPNSVFFPVVCLSVMSIGAIITTANPLNTAGEIAKQFGDSSPVLTFTTSQLVPKLADSVAKTTAGGGISVVILDTEHAEETRVGYTPRGVRIVGVLAEMMEAEQPNGKRRVRDRVNQDDTAMLLYSSGTTGPSKGVMSSHGNLIASVARFIAEPLEQDQIFICPIPLFHTFGLLNFCMVTVAMGSTVVLLPKFELHGMLMAVEKYRATTLFLVPPIVVAMINGADSIRTRYDLRSLRLVRCGGAPLSKEVTEGFLEHYPTVEIHQGYALTESNGAGAATENSEESRRYGTVGPLSPGLEARIMDPNSCRVLGVNQTGELLLRGPSIAKGYFKNEEATRAVFGSEGWLRTGDLCYIDDDGFVFIVDRLKELIKYKGFQVPPAELEALLLTHPDILDAGVIPFPDREAGQIPMACVVRKPGTGSNLSDKQVMDFIAKQVSPYKKIRKVVFINSIPRTPSGKILRKDLIKFAASKL